MNEIDDNIMKCSISSNERILNEDQSLGCTGSTDEIKETDHRDDESDAESDREPSGMFHLIPPVGPQIAMMFLKVIESKI